MTTTQWLEVLISYSLQVLIVVATCKLLERAAATAQSRCTVWNYCFFSIVALGGAALLLPRFHLIQPWSSLEPQTLLNASATQAQIGRILLFMWSLGASAALVRWITRGLSVRRMLRRCIRISVDDVQRLVGLAKADIADSQRPAILVTDEVDGPFCWQLHEPTIVLPRFLLDGCEDDLRHVLLHELEHLKTNHPLQLFVQHLAEVICWFHPAVWRAGSWASLSREFSCDEAAANHGADSAAYLRTLLHIAERCERNVNSSAISFGSRTSEIVLRARQLVKLATDSQEAKNRFSPGRKFSAATICVVVCCASLLWVPTDPLTSSRSPWSPWPSWTAKTAYCFGFGLRDYEQYDPRVQVFEIIHEAGKKDMTFTDASDHQSRASQK